MQGKPLRVPSMLKSTLEKQETLKKSNRYMSPARGARIDPDQIHNPFKFIESALKDAKARIFKTNINEELIDNVNDREE